MNNNESAAHQKVEVLRGILHEIGSLVLGFSGGVDSTFLLRVAVDTLGTDNVLAVSARSPTYPDEEFKAAREYAESLGARFKAIDSGETDVPEFCANPSDRCYYCKRELFGRLAEVAREEGLEAVCDGTNADDLSDHRPGRRAIDELGVRSPLMEAGFSKNDIRELSREMDLPTWDKPALACLASRFPYGTEITTEKLEQIAGAERALRARGFRQIRVRHHGAVARIEVGPEEISRFVDRELAAAIVNELKALGFSYVALDLEGYRTGSMNEVLPEEKLESKRQE